MSHIHLFNPGANITCDTSAAVTAGRLVEITGDRTVAHSGAASVKVFGVAATDEKSSGRVLVLRGGVHQLLAASVIAAGDRVASAADGKVAKAADGSGIGLALTAGAAGVLVEVALD